MQNKTQQNLYESILEINLWINVCWEKKNWKFQKDNYKLKKTHDQRTFSWNGTVFVTRLFLWFYYRDSKKAVQKNKEIFKG